MDETLQDLENELKRLTPRQPSAALMQAMEGELGPVPAAQPAPRDNAATRLRSGKWASWSLTGAAAVIALAFAMQSGRVPTAVPVVKAPSAELAAVPAHQPVTPDLAANRYEPIQATSVLYDLQESDPTTLPDRTEGREVRYRYVDTYTWKNPATNASLRWSLPRDEVRLVRANLD